MRGIVFDLDGTLVDSYPAICESLNHALQAFRLDPLDADTVRRMVGRGLECLVRDVLGPERVEEGVRLFRERYAAVFLERTVALDGAFETLAALHAHGIRLAVASNKPARFSRPLLDGLGLAGFVASVHGPDTVGSTKPDPAMLRRCMADLGVTAAETLYVGDMLMDVASATEAGVPVALVLGGSAGEAELRATGQPVLASLTELRELLLGHRSGGGRS